MLNTFPKLSEALATNRRKLLIFVPLCLPLILSVIWDVRLFLSGTNFSVVWFDWDAKTGFRMITACPPKARPDFIGRVYIGTTSLQARYWIGSMLENDVRWSEAQGHCGMKFLPLTPLVLGINMMGEPPCVLIDPKVTPLMLAAERDNAKLVKLLLASGADVNAQDQRGWTPLMHASMTGSALGEVIQALLAGGADVNAKDLDGRTALIWAIRNGPAKVSALLRGHADTNVMSKYGEIPLIDAVDVDNREMVTELLAAKADPNARDKDGHTPLGVAKLVGDFQMVELLKNAGAIE